MAVIRGGEVIDQRRFSSDWTNRRLGTRTWEIFTDTNTDDGPTVLAWDNLPRRGDPHPEDDSCFLIDLGADQDPGDPRKWHVTLSYDSTPGGDNSADGATAQKESLQPNLAAGTPNGGAPGSNSASGANAQSPGQRKENPLQRPAVFTLSFQQTTEVLREAFKTDEDGNNVPGTKSVLNSSGLMFDPPVTVEVSRPLLKISINYAELYLANICELQDAVNSKPWQCFAARQVRCVGVEAESAWENDCPFWKVTYNLAIKWDGWEIRVLDSGLYERVQIGTDSATGKPVYEWRAIKDKHGHPVTEPVPLDGKGAKKKPDDPETYLTFSGYKQRDFNKLIPPA